MKLYIHCLGLVILKLINITAATQQMYETTRELQHSNAVKTLL